MSGNHQAGGIEWVGYGRSRIAQADNRRTGVVNAGEFVGKRLADTADHRRRSRCRRGENHGIGFQDARRWRLKACVGSRALGGGKHDPKPIRPLDSGDPRMQLVNTAAAEGLAPAGRQCVEA